MNLSAPSRGMGCALSTQAGTDCDSFWYYTWPPCWSNSRDDWATICGNISKDQGGGSDVTCGVGGCGPDYLLGIPLTGAALQDAISKGTLVTGLIPLALVVVGAWWFLNKGRR